MSTAEMFQFTLYVSALMIKFMCMIFFFICSVFCFCFLVVCKNFSFFGSFSLSHVFRIIPLLLLFSVTKNNSNTTFCSEFSAFLKPFSMNCD